MDLCDPDLDLNADLDDYLLHPQPQHSIRIIHAFMNNDRVIEHVCQETVATDAGVLRQEQLIWCIKQQQQRQRALNRVHFKLRAMFLYNMDLAAEEMRDFFQSNQSNQRTFITPISAVENVIIRPTIPMFARLNALHIMYEASDHQPNQPNQRNQRNQPNQPNQSKKRVVIHSKKRKQTRRM